MFWRQMRNYLIPKPVALTLVWAAVIACGIIAAFSGVVGLSTGSVSTGLIGFSTMGLPVMAVLLGLAVWSVSRSSSACAVARRFSAVRLVKGSRVNDIRRDCFGC